ncbi:O-antigen ligase family protein [Paenibacillus sp. NPDC058071]|uniref:O-antigen ligase family protein n=1 Tax=Paenibacillus sp. NPDC058071 TaxID=3346326 RepID=UPI0036DB2566
MEIMESVVRFIAVAKPIFNRMAVAVGVTIGILLIGWLSANHGLRIELWQFSIVLLLSAVAFLLQHVRSVALLPYVMAVWAVGPEIRRLLDWSFHVYSETPILSLAPYFVSLPLLIPVVSGFKSMNPVLRRIVILFALLMGYGLVLGIVQFGAVAAVYDFISYLCPVFILAYVHTAQFGREVHDRWLKSFSRLAVIVALYGIVQYLYLPEWDRFWMHHSGMMSIGQPEPLKVRVFSTLNSPGPAGVFFAFALGVMVMNKRWRALGLAGMLIVAFALLITLVRSAWVALVVMLIVYFVSSRAGKAKLSAMLAVLLLAYQFVLPSLPGADAIISRINTLGSLNQDVSYNERLSFSSSITNAILYNPIGNGLGSTGLSAKLNNSAIQSFDNGYLNVLYTFGVIGGIAFIGMLLMLARAAFRSRKIEGNYASLSLSALGALLFLLLGSNILPGVMGAVFWMLASLAFASHQPEGKGETA